MRVAMCAAAGHYEWLRSPDEYLSNTMTLVDLDPGTTYQLRVVAKNGHGYEAPAAWLAFHTPGVGESCRFSSLILNCFVHGHLVYYAAAGVT